MNRKVGYPQIPKLDILCYLEIVKRTLSKLDRDWIPALLRLSGEQAFALWEL